MFHIQTYLVAEGPKRVVKADLGLVTYPEIPLQTQSFSLGDGKRYKRRNLHVQPRPMELDIEEISQA